jgi:excisionase family DNA binding protein|tara:strand:+ start:205 stop:408 length:204 start_codon:yes stop_codon:yes gene_type:complete
MDKMLYTVLEAKEMLGIGRNRLYGLVKENKIKTVKVGTHIKITKESIDDFMSRLERAGSIDDLQAIN